MSEASDSSAPDGRLAGQRQKKFAANALRLAFAVGGLITGHRLGLEEYRWLFVAYGLLGITSLGMIARGRGGEGRSLVTSAADLLLITFVVYRTGSLHSPFVALYVIATMIYGVAQSARTAGLLSVLACVLYVTLVALERWGVLPYAPDSNSDVVMFGPASSDGVTVAALVLAMLVASSISLGMVALSARKREARLESLTRELRELSRKDPLTGLFNRRYVEREVQRALAWTRRGREAVVMMIDLDGFKPVNDTAGHAAGDQLLIAISESLLKCVREVDVVGRLGGDEFLVILNDTNAMQSIVVGKRIVDMIRGVGAAASPTTGVTASVGLAVAGDNDTVASLLERADALAYEAKSLGGDQMRGGDRSPCRNVPSEDRPISTS